MPFVIFMCFACNRQSQEEKIYRVGIVSSFKPFSMIADGFEKKMVELGYREGDNIFYIHETARSLKGNQTALQEFFNHEFDLIFCYPTEAALTIRELTKGTDIPVVFSMASTEGNTLINSLDKPGKNITGVRFAGSDQIVKRLELLLELLPDARNVLVTYDADYPSEIHLQEALVTSSEEIKTELLKCVDSGESSIQGIIVMPDDISQTPAGWKHVKEFSHKYRVPIVGGGEVADVVMEYSTNFIATGAQAAELVDKIFKGTEPGSIMVQTPPSKLILNYKVAQSFGLKVPEGLLSKADKIIR